MQGKAYGHVTIYFDDAEELATVREAAEVAGVPLSKFAAPALAREATKALAKAGKMHRCPKCKQAIKSNGKAA